MPNTTYYDFPLLKSDVTLLVQGAVLSALEGNVYDHKKVCDDTKVNDWIANVTTSCVDDLRRLSPNPSMTVVVAVYGVAITSASSS
ncbi:hypothetical protein PybrP1_011367 [[Pythium] brassicae (nom. inval.)]|nr:hypothetical protein PybrP1_011367 [[Pythium] brassicae (nom. inval.)]